MNVRENQILELLEQKGSVDNQTLSQQLNCSTVTIRTAVRALEKQGLLERTHGGVKALNNNLLLSVPAGNIFKDKENKLKIAEKAYQYLEERDTIILDDSSNSYYLAKVIKQMSNKHLIVITNSLAIAAELANCQLVDVIMIGGMMTGELPSFIDDFAINTLKNFKAAKAFIGVHSIDPEVGITSIGNDQMRFKKLIFEVSKSVYVLACGNKFSSGYLLVSAKLEQVHRIITDKTIKSENIEKVRSQVALDIV